jgi:hypothetical protein
MATLPRPEGRDHYAAMRQLKWSPTEKVIARKAFDAALQRELASVIRKAKDMAVKIQQPADLWDLELYLTKRRREINRQYDYRYSVLLMVFADLIQHGRLREEELRGLAQDKLGYIHGLSAL